MSQSPSSPGVHFPPPLLFAAGVGIGIGMQRFWPLTWEPILSESFCLISGWLFAAIGSSVVIWGLVTFRRARTAIYPNQPAQKIVQHGPYRFSRNPMYVGLSCLSLGISLVVDNVWILLTLPGVLLLLTLLVVRREEAYLRASFGEAYEQYCQQVRRWL